MDIIHKDLGPAALDLDLVSGKLEAKVSVDVLAFFEGKVKAAADSLKAKIPGPWDDMAIDALMAEVKSLLSK